MSQINFLGVVSVTGLCFIIKQIFTSEYSVEAQRSKKLIGMYRPTLSDKRLNDGGPTLKANILGQPQEGTV